MGHEHLALAAEFPAATGEQWGALVAKLLSKDGAPLDAAAAIAKLRTTTDDGITIEPLYVDHAPPAVPVAVRGGTPWEVRQVVPGNADPGLAEAELEKGATAIAVALHDHHRCDTDALDHLLSGVLLDLAPVHLQAGRRWQEAGRSLLDLLDRRGITSVDAAGSLGADPLGELLASGAADDLDAQLSALGEWATELAATRPHLRLLAVRGTVLHEAGGSDAQELGGAIAMGVAYLRLLVGRGVAPATAFATIELQLAATADQFSTIAKFRAARRLWARVAEVIGDSADAASTPVHAVTSEAMMTGYDPFTNSLRTTVACFAAGVGGADSVTVLPFDHLVQRPNPELGRRLARNTQSILALESNLARVGDPAAGSWYVETLTDQLAAAAWEWFQEIEAAGGFRTAVERGLVAQRLDDTWQRRARDLDTRRRPITGVSEFPDIGETPPMFRDDPPAAGLARHHLAERFEALRRRVDAHAASSSRPSVFLAMIGPPAASTARAGFAKNFFEVAGITTTAGPDTTDAAAIAAAFTASAAPVACICSSDAVYADHAEAVATALKGAGAQRTYLAGRPRDLADRLTAAGVDGLVYAGCDARATLAELIDSLGIA